MSKDEALGHFERAQTFLTELLQDNHDMVCDEEGEMMECQDSDCMRLRDALLDIQSARRITMEAWRD